MLTSKSGKQFTMHIKAKSKESLRALYASLQKIGKGVEKVAERMKKGKVKPEGASS